MVDAIPSEEDARRAVLTLLANRTPHATVCPSEVARALVADEVPEGWRAAMPIVHAAVDALVVEGMIALSWKGRGLATRAGPYRIRRPASGALPISSA